MIILGISAALAVGAFVFVAMMLWAERWITKKRGVDVDEYYFDVPRKPEPTKTIDIVDALGRKLMVFTYSFLAIVIMWIYIEMCLGNALERVEQTIDMLQEGSGFLFPVMMTVVAIYSTLKKPYYVLFQKNDVIKRYHIYGLVECAVIAWAANFGVQLIAAMVPACEERPIETLVYSIRTFLGIVCVSLCVIIILISCKIFLSDHKCELKIMDTLYYQINYFDCYLARIPSENLAGLDVIEDYVIGRLEQRTRNARGFQKYIGLSAVKFRDAVYQTPIDHRYRPWKSVGILLVCIMGIGGGIVGVTLSCVGLERIALFVAQNSGCGYIILAITIIVLIIWALLLNCHGLILVTRANIYGRWGYCFLDEEGTVQSYIPRYHMAPTYMTRWLDALLNLLTLYRIERISCHGSGAEDQEAGVLRKLRDVSQGPQAYAEEERFALALAYYLCLNFELDVGAASGTRRDDVEGERDRILQTVPQKELLVSWADAIWVDVKRDMKWYEKYKEERACATKQETKSK